MYSRKLYATGSATGNAVASITIPSRSKLVAVCWAVALDMSADNSLAFLELSKASATEIAVNGAQQCISEVRAANNLVTSGMALGCINLYQPTDVDLDQGQILYLHTSITTTTYYANLLLWLK